MAAISSSMLPATASASATSACGTDAFGNVSCSSPAIGSKAGLVTGAIAGVIVLLIALTCLIRRGSKEPAPAPRILRRGAYPKESGRHGEFIPSYQQSQMDPIVQVDCTHPPSYQQYTVRDDQRNTGLNTNQISRFQWATRSARREAPSSTFQWDNPSPFTQTTWRVPAIAFQPSDISPFEQEPDHATDATLIRQTGGDDWNPLFATHRPLLSITIPAPTFQHH